jgi:tetratricopeptide (TPR) repeat protein
MRGIVAPQSPAEAKHWKALMNAWGRESSALHRELALEYTRAYPNNVWGWVALADALTTLLQFDAAKAALQRAQKLAPPQVAREIQVQWGHYYTATGKLSTASRWYDKAVRDRSKGLGDASHQRALIYLGDSLQKQGRLREAQRCFERVIKRGDALSDEAFYKLALLYRAQAEYAAALQCLDHALQIDPRYQLAKQVRADVVSAMRRVAATGA